jgi:hypothetical protein
MPRLYVTAGSTPAAREWRLAEHHHPAFPSSSIKPSRSGRADPFIGAIGEQLVLPDRNGHLELVDQLVACSEGLSPVRARNTNDHGKIAYDEMSNTVDGCQCTHRIVRSDLFCDYSQLVDGCGMRRVLQAGDQPAGIMITNRPNEERNPARSRIGDGSKHLIHR